MNSIQNGAHPLPPPPPSQQDAHYPQRPRSKSNFSFRSDKSHKSGGSNGKIDLTESPKEKHSRKLSTKADPRLAMSEAEPSAVAANAGSALAPIRAIQHRDANGLPIADPDRSNPTRNRWERPLDTIRSFEAAIDGNYNSRKSPYMRSESSDSAPGAGRRSNYFGFNTGTMTPRVQQDGNRGYRAENYGDRTNPAMRPDSYHDANGGTNHAYNAGRPRQMYPRTASEPKSVNGPSVYPPNGNPQSYETVTTASGSGSSGEPVGYTTDPSSENSSVHKYQPPKFEFGETPGHGGPPRPPTHNGGMHGWPASGNNSELTTIYQGQSGYPPNQRNSSMSPAPPRVPIKLGSSNDVSQVYEPSRPTPEKRKSWLGRRFSKN